MLHPLLVFGAFVISGAIGAFAIWIVFLIMRVKFGLGKFAGAFLFAGILGVAILVSVVQKAVNANF
jgi:hypothetical protein